LDKRTGKRVKNDRTTAKQSEYSLDRLFERFYTAKVAEGRARGTLENYRLNYGFFCEFLDVRKLPKDVRIITTDLIREYIVWMLTEKVRFEGSKYKPDYEQTVGLSPVSVNTRLRTLRTFFKFLKAEGDIDHDPMENVKNVEEDENEIEVLSVDELKRLLNAPNQRKYSDFRDYVLMNVLLDGFFRINEALSIRKQDIDFSSGMVTVRAEVAKSRRTRFVPLKKNTMKLLAELIKETEEFDSDYVFLANYGEPLSANHFRSRLKEYARKAGLRGRIHPHLFRHTAATMFLEAGGDIRHLQLILGHSDLRMVMKYTHLSKKSIKNQHEQYSPMNEVISKLNRERKILR
jgi:integrase/recombinase XerD